MTEVEKMLAMTPDEIRASLKGPKRDAVKASYRKAFPPVMGMFPRRVTDDELVCWWQSFVSQNTSRQHWMRDGWLSGIDYGDF